MIDVLGERSSSVDQIAGPAGLNLSSLNRDRVSFTTVAVPRANIETGPRGCVIRRNFVEGERLSWPTNRGRVGDLQKINAEAYTYYSSSPARVDQKSRFFINGNLARSFRPAIRHDAGQKSQASPHAIAFRKMTVSESVLQTGNFQKVAHCRYALDVGVR